MGAHMWTSAGWLAEAPSPLPVEPPIDPGLVSPGYLGLAAFLFLVIAVALLYRSMRKQLRKVDQNIPEDSAGSAADAGDERRDAPEDRAPRST